MSKTMFSHQIENVPKSFIREILKLIEDDNIISLAGGLPNPQFFPVEEFKKATNKALTKDGTKILQYSTTEGYRPLREFIANRYYEKKDISVDPEEILITNGAQQGIDLVGRVLLNEGDGVLIENPSYLAAIQSLSFYKPQFHPLEMQEEGPNIQTLQKIIKSKKVKFFYTIPNFQNPTGVTYSIEKRKEITEILRGSNIIILEDDPYGELQFNDEESRSFRNIYEKTILLGSFSKIVSPGCRLGWVCTPKELFEKIYIAKQASDLHSNYFTQRVLFQYLEDNDIDTHINKIRKFYKQQKETMIGALEEYLPENISFTNPNGGMFLWVTLPKEMDAMELFHKAIEEGVAFVPGEPFFVENAQKNTLRLNFSNVSPEKIKEGIIRLRNALNKMKS
jgi:2-aminoadipate transaminase